MTGVAELGRDLPEMRPGCGAKNVEPGVIERLKVRFNETGLKSRRIEIGDGRGRAGGDVRARLVGRAAAGAADRGARLAHARRHGARPAGGAGAGAAGACRGDGREDRDQRGDGRLQAGISAGRVGCGRGSARRELCDARRIGDDDVRRAGGHRQRPDPAADRHERQGQCAGPGQPRQCRDRPRLAARHPQHRRGTAAGGRPRHPRQSRQAHLLLRRGRGGVELGAAVGRARSRSPDNRR